MSFSLCHNLHIAVWFLNEFKSIVNILKCISEGTANAMYTEYVYDATVQLNRVTYTGYTQNYLLKNIESLCILIVFFSTYLTRLKHIDEGSLLSVTYHPGN